MSMDSKARIEKALAIATDTKVFEMGRGVSALAPEIFRKCFPGRKAVIVADVNTWPVLGEKVWSLFDSAKIEAQKYIIDKKEFHAEWKYVEMVDSLLDGSPEKARQIENDPNHKEAVAEECFRMQDSSCPIAVAVGSGVINDLCKLASHHHGQPYMTLPTAASVDGYSSFGASISYQNSKQTFSCPAPLAIIADIDVIAAAPKKMTAAGYADLAAKIPAGAEWMIADLLGAEPIDPPAWHVLQDVIDDQLSSPEGTASGDPDAIAGLFEGLTLSGIAMQAARSSRPASCSDHLFSHILDMTHYRFNGELQSHGFQVAIGTLTMCGVFDRFLKMDLTQLDVEKCVAAWPSLEQEQERALLIFKDFPAPMLGYEQISKKYDDASAVRRQLKTIKECWPEFREKLKAQVYTFEKMQALMRAAGAPADTADIGLTRQQVWEMFPKVQLMRPRFNILDLAKRGGFYDSLVDSVFSAGGAWEIRS